MATRILCLLELGHISQSSFSNSLKECLLGVAMSQALHGWCDRSVGDPVLLGLWAWEGLKPSCKWPSSYNCETRGMCPLESGK